MTGHNLKIKSIWLKYLTYNGKLSIPVTWRQPLWILQAISSDIYLHISKLHSSGVDFLIFLKFQIFSTYLLGWKRRMLLAFTHWYTSMQLAHTYMHAHTHTTLLYSYTIFLERLNHYSVMKTLFTADALLVL